MSLLKKLKDHTANEHAALEAQLDITRHFQSTSSYRALLEKFYTLYAPLEEKLAAAVDWEHAGWNFEARRKTPWLEQDLLILGLAQPELEALPLCEDLPQIQGLPEAIGCLYVLEGSTLGGQFITRFLQKSLPDVTPDMGGSFFAGYRDQTGPQWRQFGEWAEAQAARDPVTENEALTAARETFSSFARWFNF